MMEERDALMTHCWPELRSFCQKRQVELIEVDLRWGIAEEQSTRKETLKLCLDEIRACRPFFIGLLGERYGWVPGDDAYTADLKEEQPWLKEIDGKSVTELEILHGVLNNPEMAGLAFFYFRDPKYVETVPIEKKASFLSETPNETEKQTKLKDLIRDTCTKKNIPLIEGYSDPQSLAPIILEQLKAAIEMQFPVENIPDQLISESRNHEAFAESRCRTYIGSPDYFETLDSHCNGIGKPLVLLGESGSGKSALMANWIEHWRTDHPNDFIFQHYIGGTPDSSIHWKLMSRLIAEIKLWIDDPDETPKTNDNILGDFPIWLKKAKARAEHKGIRFVVVLDALNQLEDKDHGRILGWLPEKLFTGALRLIVSTLPGESLETIKKLTWHTCSIHPLSLDERQRMIVEYLARFSKKLDESRLKRISAEPASANPLYLKILLDELRVTGTHDQLDKRLDDYLSAKDIPALLCKVLSRYQRDYEHERKGLVCETLSLIWAARRGLTENELLHLLKPSDLPKLPLAIWSPFRAALDESMIERVGILNFGHDFLRKAVESSFLPDIDIIDNYRIQLADFFDSFWSKFGADDVLFPMLEKGKTKETDELGKMLDKSDDYWFKVNNTVVIIQRPTKRGCDELPWLLWQAELFQRLRGFLLNIDCFLNIFYRDRHELRKYWVDLGEETSIGKDYLSSFKFWEKINTEERISEGAKCLGFFLSDLSLDIDAEILFRLHNKLNETKSGNEILDYASSLDHLGDHLIDLNRISEAEVLLRKSIKIYEELNYHPAITSPLNNLGNLLSKTNRLEEAEPIFRQALKINEQNLGENHLRVAINTENLADLLRKRNKFNEAEALIRKALRIFEDFYGLQSPQLSNPLNNLVAILVNNNRYSEAEPLIRRALKIDEENLGKNHKDIARDLSNLAVILFKTNRLNEAENCINRAVQIYYYYVISNGTWLPRLEELIINYSTILNNLYWSDDQIISQIIRIAPKYFELNPEIDMNVQLSRLLQKGE